MSHECLICKTIIIESNGLEIINLNEGSSIHSACLKKIESHNEDDFLPINICKKEIEKAKIQLFENKKNILIKKINNFFKVFNKKLINNEIKKIVSENIELKKNISDLNLRLAFLQKERKTLLTYIYDNYPEYPPDWTERRKAKILATHGRCEKCKRFSKHKELHHIKPLGRGGSNKLSNLLLLCSRCHRKEHGVSQFEGGGKSKISTIMQNKLTVINEAIRIGKNIIFSYTDREKVTTLRKVKPKIIQKGITVDGTFYAPESLYFSGFCFVDNDERYFKLERINGSIKIEHE